MKILLDNMHIAWLSTIKNHSAIMSGKATLKYRKDFVSNLHNTVELSLKQIMLDQCDRRVASIRNVNSIETAKLAEAYYLASDLNYFFMHISSDDWKYFYSIEFNRFEDLYKKILTGFNYNDSVFKTGLKLLKELRNNETHFFIDDDHFLNDTQFLQLHNFMVDFQRMLNHFQIMMDITNRQIACYDIQVLDFFSYKTQLKKAYFTQTLTNTHWGIPTDPFPYPSSDTPVYHTLESSSISCYELSLWIQEVALQDEQYLHDIYFTHDNLLTYIMMIKKYGKIEIETTLTIYEDLVPDFQTDESGTPINLGEKLIKYELPSAYVSFSI